MIYISEKITSGYIYLTNNIFALLLAVSVVSAAFLNHQVIF